MSAYDPDAFDAFEAAGWTGKEFEQYDWLGSRVTSRFADPLLDAVDAGPGTRLLDVATGPGYVAGRAQERGARPVGLDLSQRMLAAARARWPEIEFVEGDVTALPFPDAGFDGYVAAFVLLHLGRPEAAAAEAHRVLRPGARAAYTVWDEPSRSRWLGILIDAIAAAGAEAPADLPAGPPIFRFADEQQLAGLLTGAGFVDVDVRTVGFGLPVSSADELWHGVVGGTVRLRPLVVAQPAEVQHEIRARFDELLSEYRSADGFEVPVSVKLASARKDS